MIVARGCGVLAAGFVLGLAACGEPARDAVPSGGGQGAAGPAVDSAAVQPSTDTAVTVVNVFFTRDERPRPVTREVPRTRAVLRAALEELLEGPTAEERAMGLRSFFSAETAGMLNGVTLDERGHAVVDFADFSRVIPNASTSAGSAAFLGELNATVFQFPTVRTVEYRLDGSCEAFWNWLQRGGCPHVSRPGG